MPVCQSADYKVLVFHPEPESADEVAEVLRAAGLPVVAVSCRQCPIGAECPRPELADMDALAFQCACIARLREATYPVIVLDLTHQGRVHDERARTGPECESARQIPRSAGVGLRLSDAAGESQLAVDRAELGDASPAGGRDESDAGDPLGLLRTIRRVSPLSRVIGLVGPGTDLDTCCRAVTLGVTGFVEWQGPRSAKALVDRVRQAADRYRAIAQEDAELHRGYIFDQTGLAGQSRLMAELLLQARRAAMISDVPVLIHGESGTGKQLVAEAIHRLDPKRRNLPFLSVNCAAIHGTLAESALFGHVRGAFTGATEARQGYFRAAGGGTILLDEISELEPPLQPKLLRVLQAGKVLPVGSDVEVDVSARVIAASNRPLPALVEEGKFRLDLYQRLNVISLNVPPLRDRPEDIPLLVQFFLRKYASYYPAGIEEVDPRVYEVLAQSVGSGNVRELENIIRQVLAFKSAGHRLELADLPRELLERRVRAARSSDQVYTALASAVAWMIRDQRWSLQDMLEQFERIAIREALLASRGTHEDLARRLGVTRRTLYNKFRKYGFSGRAG